MTKQQKSLINYLNAIMKPKPVLTGAEWADINFSLSAESSSLPGRWKTRPYQKDIVNAMTDLESKIVIIKKPTRIGYNKMINISIAYFIEQQPSTILFYNPSDDEAKGIAESEIEPMIRDNTIIRKLIDTPNIRGRIKKEKTIKKNYPGGYLEILGSESDRNFNRRTARIVIGDEVDTWKKEAGKAGDTITTMLRRSQDFEFRKNIIGGKPVGIEYDEEKEMEDGVSVVDYWFKKGDQRYRHLPCPHCGNFQHYEFEDFIWEKEKDENGKTIKHFPETVHVVCEKCNGKIYDHHKRKMDKKGKWIAKKHFNGIASFHLWAMLSYSPNVKWSDIVQEFLDAKNSRLKLKAFYNEVLARTWEEDYETVNIGDFEERKEVYTSQIPNGVLILTFGADTQDDRIEVEVIGWGEAEESWSIEYRIFHGDTSKPEVWARFDEFLLKTYHHDNGGLMKIYCGGIDTQGHRAKQAYAFCKPRFARRIFAFKGAKAIDAPVAPRLASRKNKGNVPLFMIGVNAVKDVIYSHIMTETIGAGYMHFPSDENYNDEYFKQLTAEKRGKDGRWVKERARNEALDVRVYGYASLFVAGVDLELLAQRGALMFTQKEVKPRPRPQIKNHLEEF